MSPGNDKMRFFNNPMLFFRMKSCKECWLVEKNLCEALVQLNICQAIMIIDIDNPRGRNIAASYGVVESPTIILDHQKLGLNILLNKERLLEVLTK